MPESIWESILTKPRGILTTLHGRLSLYPRPELEHTFFEDEHCMIGVQNDFFFVWVIRQGEELGALMGVYLLKLPDAWQRHDTFPIPTEYGGLEKRNGGIVIGKREEIGDTGISRIESVTTEYGGYCIELHEVELRLITRQQEHLPLPLSPIHGERGTTLHDIAYCSAEPVEDGMFVSVSIREVFAGELIDDTATAA